MSAVMGPRGGGPRSGVTPPSTRDPIPLTPEMEQVLDEAGVLITRARRPSDDADRIWAQARHQRRMQLMQELGDTNRQETRAHIFWIVAAVLAVIALVFGSNVVNRQEARVHIWGSIAILLLILAIAFAAFA